MFSPTKSSIKEANDHLQALYKRVSDLETTVKEQAESLMKRDEEAQQNIEEVARNSGREISELRKSLEASESHVQSLLASCREKDTLISHLQYKCKLLDDACQTLPALDQLSRVLIEGQRFSGGTTARSNHVVGNCTKTTSPPGGPPAMDGDGSGVHHQQHHHHHNNSMSNSRQFSISEDDDEETEELRFRQDSTHSTV